MKDLSNQMKEMRSKINEEISKDERASLMVQLLYQNYIFLNNFNIIHILTHFIFNFR